MLFSLRFQMRAVESPDLHKASRHIRGRQHHWWTTLMNPVCCKVHRNVTVPLKGTQSCEVEEGAKRRRRKRRVGLRWGY